MSVRHRRFIRYINLTLQILKTDPSVVVAEDILHWTLASLGCLSNLLLLFIILRNRKELLRLPSNILLLNLAIVNLIYVVTSLSVKINTFVVQTDHASSNIVLKSASIPTACQSMLSNWTLAVLAVFNFLAVKSSLKFRAFITRRMTVIIIVMLWIVAIVLSTLPRIMKYPSPKEMIVHDELSNSYFTSQYIDNLMTYAFVLDCLSVFPAATLILILYPILVSRLRKRKNIRERSEGFRNKMNNSIRPVTFIYVTFLVYLSFDITISLSLYYVVLSDFTDDLNSSRVYTGVKFISVVFLPFRLFHTILNPIIHALLTENYRKYYFPLLWKFSTIRHKRISVQLSI